jgi:hypothetical protein
LTPSDEYGDWGFRKLNVQTNYFENNSIYALRGNPQNASAVATLHGNVLVNTADAETLGRGLYILAPCQGVAHFNWASISMTTATWWPA